MVFGESWEINWGVILRFLLRVLCVGASWIGFSDLRARCFVYQGDTRALEEMGRSETSSTRLLIRD